MKHVIRAATLAGILVLASTSFTSAGCGGGSPQMAASAYAVIGTRAVSEFLNALLSRGSAIGKGFINSFLWDITVLTTQPGFVEDFNRGKSHLKNVFEFRKAHDGKGLSRSEVMAIEQGVMTLDDVSSLR